MTQEQFMAWLRENDACGPAISWAKGYDSMHNIWVDCPYGRWLAWWLKNADYSAVGLTKIAVRCIRETPTRFGGTVLDLMPESKYNAAFAVVERWLMGTATYGDVRNIELDFPEGFGYLDQCARRSVYELVKFNQAFSISYAINSAGFESGSDRFVADLIRSMVPWRDVQTLMELQLSEKKQSPTPNEAAP